MLSEKLGNTNILKLVRFVCITFVVGLIPFQAALENFAHAVRPVAEQKSFIAGNGRGIETFLQESFSNANSGMIIGL